MKCTDFTYLQYCDQEITPRCAERCYQPIRIAYLLSFSILIGASSEISGAERTLLLISQIWAGFWKTFLQFLNSSGSADCLEFFDIFCFQNEKKTIALYLRDY